MTAEKEAIRFAQVGAGVIGQLRAQALRDLPGTSLRYVFDVDEAAARALAEQHGARATTDYNGLLAIEDFDVVIVSSPPQFHEAQVVAALEAGKDVLCEKPLANSLDAARNMVETARRLGRTLTTGFNHRYFPAIQTVKRAIDDGLIGELDHVRAFAGHQGLSQFRAPWEYDKAIVGGGALMDVGIHMMDLTRYLLGEVNEVYGKATSNVWNLDGSEDNGMLLLRSTAGKYATFQATWSEWKGYRFHIEAYGTHGMARAYYAPMMSTVITMDEPGGAPEKSRNFYPEVILREKLQGWQWTVQQTFQQELADFQRVLRGETSPTIADGFAGFRAVEIANAVYRCTQENVPIPLSAPF
jgi:predicted dehydrogenase